MRAILLAGGQGTRLRPLTLNTPKPVVPIFDLPFLQYQIDVLRQVPEVDDIVLSLNVFRRCSATGLRSACACIMGWGPNRSEPAAPFDSRRETTAALP